MTFESCLAWDSAFFNRTFSNVPIVEFKYCLSTTKSIPPCSLTYSAEYVKEHGGIDLVVERQYLNSTIGTLLNVLLKKAESQAKQDSNVTVDKSLQAAS